MPCQASAADSLTAVVDSVFAAGAYEWPERRDLLTPLFEAFRGALNWLWTLESSRPSAYWAIMVAMLVILGVIVAHALWIFRRTVRFARDHRGREPAPVPARSAARHLAEAQRLAAAGRFAEALAHRFQATLRVLQDRRLLRLRHDRTPAEYVREARIDAAGRDRFGHLVTAFYDVVFGGRPLDLDGLRTFDALARDVERSPAAG